MCLRNIQKRKLQIFMEMLIGKSTAWQRNNHGQMVKCSDAETTADAIEKIEEVFKEVFRRVVHNSLSECIASFNEQLGPGEFNEFYLTTDEAEKLIQLIEKNVLR